MKKLLMAAIAVSALAAAVPALAQSYFDDRAAQMDQRIENGVRDGSLTLSDADLLRSELRSDQRLHDQYAADGMSGWQQRDLDRRFDELSNNIFRMQRDEYNYRRDY